MAVTQSQLQITPALALAATMEPPFGPSKVQ